MFWNRYPLARVLLPFIAGIIIALAFQFSFVLPLVLFLVLILLSFSFVFILTRKLGYGLRWLPGIVIMLFWLLAGYQLTVLRLNVNTADYFGQYISEKNFTVATLTEPLQVREKTCRAVVDISLINDSVGWHQTSGKAIVYLEKDSNAQKLKYGDKILLYDRFSEIPPPLNPGEFNYKNYLKYRSIDYSAYAKSHDWKLLNQGNGYAFVAFTYTIRDKLLKILEQEGIKGNEYAVVSALLIGYTDKLDPDLIKDYQGSGAMHILSVSGMHVGIVFVVLNFLLFFFDKTKYGRFPKAVILLAFVWFYALLTGMSPAVMRAAGMFSFIIAGNAFKQRPDIYNTLASSALVLLLINPFYLADVGFQLSYLAVAGIVAIYPRIHQNWRPKYRLTEKIWSLVAVSIAAQIVTFPLSMYYFHQFPNYFLLTNIIAVPLSAVVIYLGIAVLVFSSVPVLSVCLSKALTWALMLLNGSISTVEHLPFAVSLAISVTTVETILIYFLLILFLVWIFRKHTKALTGGLAVVLILMLSMSVRAFQASQQRKIIVYNIGKHTAIDLVDGNNCYFMADTAMLADAHNQEFHIFNCRYALRTRIRNAYPLNKTLMDTATGNGLYMNSGLLQFGTSRIAVVSRASCCDKSVAADVALVCQNPDMDMAALSKQYRTRLIVFDASNSAKNILKWEKQCKVLGIFCYSTQEKGAWIWNLE